MLLKDAKELAGLSAPELTEYLVRVAQQLRTDQASGNEAALTEALHAVRKAANLATGPRVELLEVAESFLKLAARHRADGRAVATHKFLSKDPIAASKLLERFLAREAVASGEYDRLPVHLREALAELVEAGVLRVEAGQILIQSAAVASVAEAFDPLAFRYWRRVEHLRKVAAVNGLSNDEAAPLFASELGVTVAEAVTFLNREPIPGAKKASVRRGNKVLYRRQREVEPDLPEATWASFRQAAIDKQAGETDPDFAGLADQVPEQGTFAN